MLETLYASELSSLPLHNRGKVRDIYQVDDQHLLIVTTDRLSAFDVVLPTPIPGKGRILTEISDFWFARTQELIPNHLASWPWQRVISNPKERAQIEGRAVLVRCLTPLPVEAIVRGYLAGSGWKDYQNTGAICGVQLPSGLQLGERLAEPIYTPSTKAPVGAHDENIDFQHTVQMLGRELASRVRDVSLELYNWARDYAATRGILIADTKFEFGLDEHNQLLLIDELLTPDSSRFWPAEQYQPAQNPPSFDKQYVRDYLESLDWNKQPPGPPLPPDIVANTARRYQEALERLTRSI